MIYNFRLLIFDFRSLSKDSMRARFTFLLRFSDLQFLISYTSTSKILNR
jgi:hypothetical protein